MRRVWQRLLIVTALVIVVKIVIKTIVLFVVKPCAMRRLKATILTKAATLKAAILTEAAALKTAILTKAAAVKTATIGGKTPLFKAATAR